MRKIKKECPICNKIFHVPYCHRDRYKTCGHKCGGIYRLKPAIINKCNHCGKEFTCKKHHSIKQSFCSRMCSSRHNRTGIYKKCIECSQKFYVIRYRLTAGSGRGTFCSKVCLIKKWNKDSIKAQKPGNYRQNAWKIYDKKCHDCGIKDERVLVIHHVDGNRKNGKINNLIPVCHNCHCLRHIKLNGNHRMPSYRGSD